MWKRKGLPLHQEALRRFWFVFDAERISEPDTVKDY